MAISQDIVLIYALSIFVTFVACQNDVNLDCSSTGQVIALDSVTYGTCSITAYREISKLCLGEQTCTMTSSELSSATSCPQAAVVTENSCVDSDKIVDICSLPNDSELLGDTIYITSPGYPSPTPPGYIKNKSCRLNVNTGYSSTVNILDINTEARTPLGAGKGCYDRLRIYIQDIQENEICGPSIDNIQGDTTQTEWLNQQDVGILFISDAQSNHQYSGFILRIETTNPITTTTTSTTTTPPTTSTTTSPTTTTTTGSPTTTTTSPTTITSSPTTTSSSTTTIAPTSTTMSTSSMAASTSSSTMSSTTSTTTATIPNDNCQRNPCQNGGTCDDDLNGAYKCTCTSQWDGTDCTIRIDTSKACLHLANLYMVLIFGVCVLFAIMMETGY